MTLLRRHLLSVDQLDRDTVEALLGLAARLEPVAQRGKVSRVLDGAVLGNLFFEASTRTRISFHAAFARLGGSVCDTVGFTFSSMAKGESIADTSRVMSGYVDVLVVRHPQKGSVAQFADASKVPVINGGDGPGEHPTQALLDLYTVQGEFRRIGKPLKGSRILFAGDLKYGRTVHSLARLFSIYEPMDVTFLSPPELPAPQELLDLLARRGHKVALIHQRGQFDGAADVIYATRIQKERFGEEGLEGYDAAFRVDEAFMAAAAHEHTVLMHPLPRDSDPLANDLSTSLDSDPRLAIFRQADNGIPVRMAIFAAILGVDKGIEASFRDAAFGRRG